MPYKNVTAPSGEKISIDKGTLHVPDQPVIPFIRGDGTGPDIWAASVRVFDAAVEKAYGGKKKIAWFEIFEGQTAKDKFDEWLPDDTVEAIREFLIGIKPVSRAGSVRLIHSAISYAIKNHRKSVTLVHKGNIMKFTEGAFRDWGYEIAKQYFGADEIDGGPWCKIPMGKPGAGIVIKDAIADITLQQVLLRPEDLDVIATLNLNGDYLSDALAAQVGGIGIATGGNISYISGDPISEATHGTAPKYANQDKVNPGSVILSGEMMLRYMGWT